MAINRTPYAPHIIGAFFTDLACRAKDETLRNLKEFSREGYRTLVLAQREVSIEEFSEWKLAFYQANNSLDNREEKVCKLDLIDTMCLTCIMIRWRTFAS